MAWQQIADSILGIALRSRTVSLQRFADFTLRAKLAAIIGLACATVFAPPLRAQSYSLIFNGFNGNNGETPNNVTLDAAGNIYGVTLYGGVRYGTIYKLTRRDSEWRFNTLYEFTGHDDGGQPGGALTFGPDGSLYGVTSNGGAMGLGVVYKLQPPSSACKTALCYWTETVLHTFTNSGDGAQPLCNVVFDHAGNMYGTTSGGVFEDFGTVWELSPSGGGWTFNLIHAFTNGLDGGGPIGNILLDGEGNLYGVTEAGGSASHGVAYEFTNGLSGWSETVLHNFGEGSQDGTYAHGLTFDAHGNLFGFTSEGGTTDEGTIYELQANNGGFTYNILYNFQPTPGGVPYSVPIFDNVGNLYGTGQGPGSGNGSGFLFELSPSGGSWNFTLLYTFLGNPDNDGADPQGMMAFDAQGTLYGATIFGGGFSQVCGSGCGTVWEYTP